MYESNEPSGFEYAIQENDTLNDLADQFYLEEEDIIDANPEVDFESLYAGQVINIPEVGYSEEAAEFEQQPMGPGVAPRITVPGEAPRFRPGERPFGRPFGRPFERPFERPGFDRFGRRRFCRRGSEYIVRPGDTLYRIARRFNLPIRELIRFNRHINFNFPLQVGDILCLPFF